jgi:pre-mRNA-splicing factor ATP-dependent RNA helicase DHX38/PRP16
LVCSSAGLDTLADKKRAAGGGSVFKPPPPKVAVAAGSIDEDEKPAGTENDATSLSTAIRSNSSRRYRGSGSDDKTSLNGASFSLN